MTWLPCKNIVQTPVQYRGRKALPVLIFSHTVRTWQVGAATENPRRVMRPYLDERQHCHRSSSYVRRLDSTTPTSHGECAVRCLHARRNEQLTRTGKELFERPRPSLWSAASSVGGAQAPHSPRPARCSAPRLRPPLGHCDWLPRWQRSPVHVYVNSVSRFPPRLESCQGTVSRLHLPFEVAIAMPRPCFINPMPNNKDVGGRFRKPFTDLAFGRLDK